MTFQNLLDALRLAEPIFYRNTPESEGLTDSDELLSRLKLTSIKAHQEWGNYELIIAFTSANKNLNSVIPCKHCGKS